MKIHLHIGQSKTGTSAIQSFLNHNRIKLLSDGYLYPCIRIGGAQLNIGANPMADSLLGLIRYPYLQDYEYFEQYYEEARRVDAHSLILSAEHLYGGLPRPWNVSNNKEYFRLYEKKIQRLKTFLNGHELSIYLYLRHQVDWFSSVCSQYIMRGSSIESPYVYKDDYQLFNTLKLKFRHFENIQRWKDIIEPRILNVVPYDDCLINNNVVDDFVYRVGLPSINGYYQVPRAKVNSSISLEYLELKKRLNNNDKPRYEELFVIEVIKYLSKSSRFTNRYKLSKALVNDIMEYVNEDNKLVTEKFIKNGELKAISKKYFSEHLFVPDKDDVDAAERAYNLFRYSFKGFANLARHMASDLLRKRAPKLNSYISATFDRGKRKKLEKYL